MKIFCIGRNYIDHAKELNNPVPTTPIIFTKPITALLTGNKPFFHPEFSKDVHHEAEIVLRVCRLGRQVQEKFAHKYYDAVAFGIDFTARDIQSALKEKSLPWDIAKGFDGSGPLSEFISLAELPSDGISFHMTKNGETVQQGNTRDMIFNFDRIISYVSQFFTLQVGDIIFTGTPPGVAAAKIGDVLEGFIEGKKMLKCAVK